jgi:beta-glucanase (GH16 family)
VQGDNFTQHTVVLWNGNSLTTTCVSATKLQASVSAANVSQAGQAEVSVRARNGRNSNSVPFVITSSAASVTPLEITTATLPSGTIGASYSDALQVTGGTAPYTWKAVSGSLPAGLTLSTSGNISGKPSSAGQSTFTLQAKDAEATPQAATVSLTIAVSAPAAVPLTITSASLPAATAGSAYSATLTAQGGTPAYTWSLYSGQLPTGLILSSSGIISGTPTASGSFSFASQVKDSATPSQSATLSLSISVAAAAPLSVTAASLPGATVGSAYSATLAAQGGIRPYTWTLASGQLPTGLTLSSLGVISGTPTASGTFTFTSQAKDSSTPSQSAAQAEVITVVAATSGQPTPPSQAAGYTLAFSDDFSTLSLSPNGLGNYNWYNPGIYWEKAAPYANISVTNSILTLDWTSGQGTDDTSISTTAVNGSQSRAWRYGYFEVNMKWDPVTGSWPAIWLLPVQGISGTSETGELDIFEGQGAYPHTYYGTIHDWQGSSQLASNSNSNSYNLGSSVDFTQYHTYGCLWVPGSVTWYFDNQPIITASTYSIFDQQNYFLIVGSQEGANWSYGNMTGVTATSLPVNVAWVHVWQKP